MSVEEVHFYVPGAILRPNHYPPHSDVYKVYLPTEDDLELQIDFEPYQVITVIDSRPHRRDHLMWWVTAIMPAGSVHTCLMFREDFVPA